MVTHIVGGAAGIVCLILTILKAVSLRHPLSAVTGSLYCLSMILVYTISSVYHGLTPTHRNGTPKKVMQILDHCDIYTLVAGTYTPIALGQMRVLYPALSWSTLGIVYAVCILGTVFTGIDHHKYGPLSYSCYFVAGWSVLTAVHAMWVVYSPKFVLFLLLGGIVYSLGMIFFVLQTKGHRYMHSVFHLFILGGGILHFLGIYLYCL